MINRELIRLKLVQIAYSYYQSGSKNPAAAEKELLMSLSRAYALYNTMLLLMVELNRMGANIATTGARGAIIEGPAKLTGCEVNASDLRAGAAMILAGLVAEGTTTVGNLHHIDRGYEDIVGKLKALGADIQRISVKD